MHMVGPSPDLTKVINIKLLCSYYGKILPRHPDGKLRYLNGETRVLAVPRFISFSELSSKMIELYGPSIMAFSLHCQLPTEDLDAFVSIKSDEDFVNLIEEYDKTASSSNLKIRAFISLTPISRTPKSISSPSSFLAYKRLHNQHYFRKVFKVYMPLWKYQQENRSKFIVVGLNRWEIGEIVSRIGQLYFGQFMRTSEARFLLDAYVFYEAILSRSYFDGFTGFGGFKKKDIGVRFKELRLYFRFLLFSSILIRTEMVHLLAELFKSLVDDCKANFQEIQCLCVLVHTQAPDSPRTKAPFNFTM